MNNKAKLLLAIPAVFLIMGIRSYNICGYWSCVPDQIANEFYDFGSYILSVVFAICVIVGAGYLYNEMRKT